MLNERINLSPLFLHDPTQHVFSGCILCASKQEIKSPCSHGPYIWPSHSHHGIVLIWALSTLAVLMSHTSALKWCPPSLSPVLQTEHKIIGDISSPQLQPHSPTFSYKEIVFQFIFVGVLVVHLLVGDIFVLTDNHIYCVWDWLV